MVIKGNLIVIGSDEESAPRKCEYCGKIEELRFKRNVAKVIYTTNLEHINGTKLQMRILESQINREWGSGD